MQAIYRTSLLRSLTGSHAPALVGGSRAFADKTITEHATDAFNKVKAKVGDTLESAGKAFESDGKVGKQFENTKKGAAAGAAEEVGGEFDKDGKIGKEFSAEKGGKIGGAVDKAAKKVAKVGDDLEHGKGEVSAEDLQPRGGGGGGSAASNERLNVTGPVGQDTAARAVDRLEQDIERAAKNAQGRLVKE